MAADAGLPEAQYEVGIRLMSADVVTNEIEAVNYFREASAGGNLQALAELGKVKPPKVTELEKDITAGIKLLLRSAEGGVPEANFFLGQLYETGQIGFIDTEKAIKFYLEADFEEKPVAALKLGMLLLAREKEGDKIWAINLIRYAADNGISDAKLNYAKLLDEGKYTKKSTFSGFLL